MAVGVRTDGNFGAVRDVVGFGLAVVIGQLLVGFWVGSAERRVPCADICDPA